MKKLLLGALLLLSTFNSFAQNSIEGKWKPQGFQNTLYIFENGERFTYYCTSVNCDSLYNTFEAGDGNNIPDPLEYSVTNDTITIDFNFGNIVVSHMAFSCEGNIVTFVNQNNMTFIRLGTNIEDCTILSVNEITTAKRLLEIKNLLGQTIKEDYNQIMIYVHDDGSIEKVFKVK